ncbi:MAG: glycosyltransferase [Gammaproteobacteria bacterium]|nr:glycosyltransferase [Gammaproteobacteria bacterium]
MNRSALLVVQHLLGSGHLRRAVLLGRALADAGMQVTVASGGMPLAGLNMEGINFVQLPPVRAVDAAFSALVDADGNVVDAAWRAGRLSALLTCFDSARPDLLVLETFPFGRRKMRFELLPLLARAGQAKKKPRIVCSVRDVLQQRKPSRAAESAEWANRYFDAVWVHGDEKFIPLRDSFPVDQLRIAATHTGYLYDDRGAAGGEGEGEGEVIVSAGGTGAAGRALNAAALAAAEADHEKTWRILMGGGAAHQKWRQHAGRARVENNRADFPQLLRNCAVSVSRAGCNTVLDLLSARARAVLVPFEEHGETEQLQRATRLGKTGRAVLLREHALTPAALTQAVSKAARAPRPAKTTVNMNGAATCAALAGEMLRRRG